MLAYLWHQRFAIADDFVQKNLKEYNVKASYKIESIGLRTQRITNLVIGDPKKPDMTVRALEVDLKIDFSGVSIQWVRAKNALINGKVDGKGNLDFGELNKFRDPDSKQPFRLPDFAIDVEDVGVALATPYGAVGVGIEGFGQLRSRFDGRIAIRSNQLAYQGCKLSDVDLHGDIELKQEAPKFVGPVSAQNIICAKQGLALLRPIIEADIALTKELDRWVGDAGFKAASLQLPDQRILGPAGKLDFQGNRELTPFTVTLNAAGYRSSAFNSERMEMTGEGRVGLKDGVTRFTSRGDFTLAQGKLSNSLTTPVDDFALRAKTTPVGPLLSELGPAVRAAMRNFNLAGRYDVGQGNDGRIKVNLDELSLASASGARLVQRGTLSLLQVCKGWQIDSPVSLAIAGGGLPTSAIALRRSGIDSWAGALTIEPYNKGGSLVALNAFNFNGRPGGAWNFNGDARVSGPIGNARVQGLRIPLNGQWAGGGITLYGQCEALSFDRLSVQGLELGAHNFRLCPTQGAIIRTRAGTPQIAARIPSFILNGRYQGTPIALNGSNIDFDLARKAISARAFNGKYGQMSLSTSSLDFTLDNRFKATNIRARTGEIEVTAPYIDVAFGKSIRTNTLAVAVGRGDEATHFTVDAVSGRFINGGFQGSLSGGQGTIATIPFLLSEVAGDWRYMTRNGAFRFLGGMLVSDRQDAGLACPLKQKPGEVIPSRFCPQQGRNFTVDYINGTITANGETYETHTGRRVARVNIDHKLSNGVGRANLFVEGLTFDEQLRPEMLTPMTRGVVADVVGTVNGSGLISWDNSGDGVRSTGSFATEDMDLSAAFGPVEGIAATINFSDLLSLETQPGQLMRIGLVNPGVEAREGIVRYQLLSGNRIAIEGGRWPFAGGDLIMDPTVWDMDEAKPREMMLRVEGLDIAQFLQQFDFDNLLATGIFDGNLPMVFDAKGGRIVGGELIARPGGGSISYIGSISYQDMGVYANFAFDALKSLKYDKLRVGMEGDLAGEIITVVSFDGLKQGDGAKRNFITRQLEKLPIKFNVRIEAEFFKLIGSMRGIYDPQYLVQRDAAILLQAQQEREAADKKKAEEAIGTTPVVNKDEQ